MIDEFTGLHDILFKGKAQGIRHLRFRAWRCSCGCKLDTSGSNAEKELRWLHGLLVLQRQVGSVLRGEPRWLHDPLYVLSERCNLADRRLGKEAVIKAGPDLEIFYPRYLLTWLYWHDWHVGFIPMHRCLSEILLLLCHFVIP